MRAPGSGLRRGAWYLVVNDNQPNVVVVNVGKDNVPIPRSMLEVRNGVPDRWSVVRWSLSQLGARRAKESNHGLAYVVCPGCAERTQIEVADTPRLTCAHCGGTFSVDWDHPC